MDDLGMPVRAMALLLQHAASRRREASADMGSDIGPADN